MTTNKKKGAPGGTPIPEQDYGTTPERRAQSLAQDLFNRISDKRPVRRPKSPSVDRAFRQLIENANRNGDCIVNGGCGYYRPRSDDELGEFAFRVYKAKELARARTIIDKITAMENAFYGRY